jgi:DNA-binding GntR family transcriptional regulator
MIECHAIDILKSNNVRDLPEVYASLIKASNLSAPRGDDENEVADYLRGLTDFHAELVASTRNPWLIAFYDSLVSTLARYQYFCLKVPGLPLRSQAMHKQIIALINKGAFDKAKETLISHIESTVDFITVYVSKGLKQVA